jgi:molecular chaperone DnaJ
VRVAVPAGVSDGEVLEVGGAGEAAQRGGPAGDLYLTVRVKPDPRFERRDDDIWTTLPLTFSEAALGAKKEVETLDGPVVVTIPEGTPTGKVFRLAGKGVPHRRGRSRGDHLVEVTVVTPTRLSRRQREILKELGS